MRCIRDLHDTEMEPDAADEQDIPTQPLDRKFIFYEPGKSRIPDPRPVWQRLIDDRLGDNARLSKRFQVQQLLRLLPRGPEVNPICTASRLASTLSTNPDERKVQQLLISILCDILYTSGRSTPEEIDSVIGTFSSKSSSTKYLEKIRRAGTTANELIIEWARSSNGDSLDRLDCATQTILQGIFLNPVAADHYYLLTGSSWSIPSTMVHSIWKQEQG